MKMTRLDHLFAHSFRLAMPHLIMVHQHWELSWPWQTEMNLDVAIRSGISFNRLHFMVMRPVPLSLNVHLSSETHMRFVVRPHTKPNTTPPAHSHQHSIRPIAPSLSITLCLTCGFITIPHGGVCLLLSTCASSPMRLGGPPSDVYALAWH